jgi:hypothetical protein
MRKKPITAEDLLRGLESDLASVAERERRQRDQEATVAACHADEADLVHEIRAAGYDVDSVWDLVNNNPHPFLERRFVGPYQRAYRVLVAHLEVQHHHKIREGIVRALTVKDGGRELEQALLREFENEPSQELRWVLANALRTAMPYHRRRKHPAVARALKDGTGLGAG